MRLKRLILIGFLTIALCGCLLFPSQLISPTAQTSTPQRGTETGTVHNPTPGNTGSQQSSPTGTPTAGELSPQVTAALHTDQPVITGTAPDEAAPPDIAHMHGFNLLSQRLLADWCSNDTEEWGFRFLQTYGFNFARIPIDYAKLYQDEEKRLLSPDALAELDAIVERGLRYDVFILLDLHTVPGFNYYDGDSGISVWNDGEKLDLWRDTLAMLAERYQDIPPDKLAINPVNEPFGISEDTYLASAEIAINRIWEISPDRWVFLDGLEWSSIPVYGFAGQHNIAASPHFYQPFTITHYRAEWVEGTDSYPEPVFPAPLLPVFFYGPYHEPLDIPLKISAPFKAGMQVNLLVDTVSADTDLAARADGKEIYRHAFHSGPGEGEWKEEHYVEEWGIYQNVYQKTYSFVLPTDATEITIAAETGDWLTITQISIRNPDGSTFTTLTPNVFDWDIPQSEDALILDEHGGFPAGQNMRMMDETWIEEQILAPWDVFTAETGQPILAGEFGVYNKTPHEVSLRVLEAYLKAFRERGWGWALWNLSDAFGILDSNRQDVTYENWEGHQLDREMLDLLLEYIE